MIEEMAIKEGERLNKKFGSLAVDVVHEIQKYDVNDWYFWQQVRIYLNAMQHDKKG
jgi:hypothetical protein